MFDLIKSRTSLKKGYVRPKTMSLGQILEKQKQKNPCVCSRGQIFGWILMKLGQPVCLDKILDEFENWSCRVKNYDIKSNFRKP